jgi:hypothetical protein
VLGEPPQGLGGCIANCCCLAALRKFVCKKRLIGKTNRVWTTRQWFQEARLTVSNEAATSQRLDVALVWGHEREEDVRDRIIVEQSIETRMLRERVSQLEDELHRRG